MANCTVLGSNCYWDYKKKGGQGSLGCPGAHGACRCLCNTDLETTLSFVRSHIAWSDAQWGTFCCCLWIVNQYFLLPPHQGGTSPQCWYWYKVFKICCGCKSTAFLNLPYLLLLKTTLPLHLLPLHSLWTAGHAAHRRGILVSDKKHKRRQKHAGRMASVS